jgi:hypothetical protein
MQVCTWLAGALLAGLCRVHQEPLTSSLRSRIPLGTAGVKGIDHAALSYEGLLFTSTGSPLATMFP